MGKQANPKANGESVGTAWMGRVAGARGGGPPGVVDYFWAGLGLRVVVEFRSPGVHFLPLH